MSNYCINCGEPGSLEPVKEPENHEAPFLERGVFNDTEASYSEEQEVTILCCGVCQHEMIDLPSAGSSGSALFVVVGRVCDEEDVLRFVKATSSDEAEAKFTQMIKVLQDWNRDNEIYIEFCVPLSDYQSFLIS